MLLIAAFSVFGTAAAAFSAAASETDPLSEEARIAAGPAFAPAQPAETEAVPETEAEIGPGVTPLSEADTPDVLEESDLISLGTFTTTGYCNCRSCAGQWAGAATASGTRPQENRTIAVDKRIIPLGTKVQIGDEMYVAEDTGGAIKGNKIDVYYSSHGKAMAHGVKYQKIRVYI